MHCGCSKEPSHRENLQYMFWLKSKKINFQLPTLILMPGFYHTHAHMSFLLCFFCRFPLFTSIHRICIRELDPREFINCLRDHPEHMSKEDLEELDFGYLKPKQAMSHVDLENLSLPRRNRSNRDFGATLTVDSLNIS